ncbi:MAG: hypothetical protein IKD44_02395 [Lentisphaeria bacterium]|nr:hypothetical protein [Lentisphaeria bacterium]
MSELRIKQLRYEFSYPGKIVLHPVVPTITLRGAFGYALAQVIARNAHIPVIADQVELYRRIFMPINNVGAYSSRNLDLARPFVLRGFYSRADKRSFILEVNLFGEATDFESFFDTVIETIAFMGVGPNKQVCKLLKISSCMVNVETPAPKRFLEVDFLTPCSRLKSEGLIFKDEIPFYVLFARLADRVQELYKLYESDREFPGDNKFVAELKHQAKNILWKKLSGGVCSASRTSGRTGQTMYLDGFCGSMGYCGDFSCYTLYLKYLPYINLGRFNVFGCGWCNMEYKDTISDTRRIV